MFNSLYFVFIAVDEEQLLTQQEQEHQLWVKKFIFRFDLMKE